MKRNITTMTYENLEKEIARIEKDLAAELEYLELTEEEQEKRCLKACEEIKAVKAEIARRQALWAGSKK